MSSLVNFNFLYRHLPMRTSCNVFSAPVREKDSSFLKVVQEMNVPRQYSAAEIRIKREIGTLLNRTRAFHYFEDTVLYSPCNHSPLREDSGNISQAKEILAMEDKEEAAHRISDLIKTAYPDGSSRRGMSPLVSFAYGYLVGRGFSPASILGKTANMGVVYALAKNGTSAKALLAYRKIREGDFYSRIRVYPDRDNVKSRGHKLASLYLLVELAKRLIEHDIYDERLMDLFKRMAKVDRSVELGREKINLFEEVRDAFFSQDPLIDSESRRVFVNQLEDAEKIFQRRVAQAEREAEILKHFASKRMSIIEKEMESLIAPLSDKILSELQEILLEYSQKLTFHWTTAFKLIVATDPRKADEIFSQFYERYKDDDSLAINTVDIKIYLLGKGGQDKMPKTRAIYDKLRPQEEAETRKLADDFALGSNRGDNPYDPILPYGAR